MHTFFVSSSAITGQDVLLAEPSQVKHLKTVLRLKVGERLRICDDQSNAYRCVVSALSPEVRLRIEQKIAPRAPARVQLAVACAIPKKSNMDDIVDKLTQLGVDVIFPLVTERVVVAMDADARKAKRLRWEKKARAAGEQSQRLTLPVIEPVSSLGEVLAKTEDYEKKLIPTLEGSRVALRKAMEEGGAKRVLVFIGPEGDFTDSEIRLAKEHGCIPVSLGPRVLRVEAAAVAAASYIMLHEDV